MKLNNSLPNLASGSLQKGSTSAASNGAVDAAQAAQAGPPSDARNSGRVHLSTTWTSLMAAANDGSGDIDMDRVADIKAAIADGTLRIDPAKIADGLLVTTQELIYAPS